MVTHGSARNKLNAWHFIFLDNSDSRSFICYENSMKYQVMGWLVRQFAGSPITVSRRRHNGTMPRTGMHLIPASNF